MRDYSELGLREVFNRQAFKDAEMVEASREKNKRPECEFIINASVREFLDWVKSEIDKDIDVLLGAENEQYRIAAAIPFYRIDKSEFVVIGACLLQDLNDQKEQVWGQFTAFNCRIYQFKPQRTRVKVTLENFLAEGYFYSLLRKSAYKYQESKPVISRTLEFWAGEGIMLPEPPKFSDKSPEKIRRQEYIKKFLLEAAYTDDELIGMLNKYNLYPSIETIKRDRKELGIKKRPRHKPVTL